MTFLRMDQISLAGKRVLIREDLNVPVRDGVVLNDTRIRAALPTIELARSSGAKIILMSHLGRPEEGVAIDEQKQFSLQPVAEKISELLGCEVRLVQDYVGDANAVPADDAVLLLENVRINKGEKADDEELAKYYASLCDVFVMDAFGTAHRAQASTHGVAKHAPTACAGLLLAGELDALARSLENPERPMLAVVGGAKVSSKLQVLENLATKVDQLIVGGGIANTFLAASGVNIGQSLYEKDLVPLAAELMSKTNIPLPTGKSVV